MKDKLVNAARGKVAANDKEKQLKLERKKLPPPIPIKVANILDLSNFDIYSEEQENAAPVNDTSGWDSCF